MKLSQRPQAKDEATFWFTVFEPLLLDYRYSTWYYSSAPGGVAAPKIMPRDFLYLYCTVVALLIWWY